VKAFPLAARPDGGLAVIWPDRCVHVDSSSVGTAARSYQIYAWGARRSHFSVRDRRIQQRFLWWSSICKRPLFVPLHSARQTAGV